MGPTFRQDRDAQGREFIEIGYDAWLYKTLAVAAPLSISVAAWILSDHIRGVMPWFFYWFPAGAACIIYWITSAIFDRSDVRITADSGAGRFLVDSYSGRKEVALADVASVEFASKNVDRRVIVSRMEFVMKSGERVPAWEQFTNVYGAEVEQKLLAAVNDVLKRRMV